MPEENLISTTEFCLHYNIEHRFIDVLEEYELIQTTRAEDAVYINTTQLSELERLTRLHYDLHINFEGLDAINHLLELMKDMQDELSLLRNRLRLYETEPD